MKVVACFLLFVALSASPLSAFPPAPHYTLYGMVRDQVGQTLSAEGAVLILLKGGSEIGRSPINTLERPDQNYELAIRIDHNRSGTTFYSDRAVAAQGLFSLVVEANGTLFYPIEVSSNLAAGKGSERVKLDLNLGEDLDGDGMPDVWEQWQLYQAGHLPDDDGKWPIDLITRDGDFDGDGSSNQVEYIAGTFAGDRTERFALEIKEKLAASVRLEFFGVTGKTYFIEKSTDVLTWTRTPFSIATPGAGSEFHTATAVGILSAYVIPTSGTIKEFYRLSVQ